MAKPPLLALPCGKALNKNEPKKCSHLEVDPEVPGCVEGDLAWLPLRPRSVQTLSIQEPDLENVVIKIILRRLLLRIDHKTCVTMQYV